MKPAEALLLRGDLQSKIQPLRSRISYNAMVQEGTTPLEDPNKLLKEAAGATEELEKLITAINTANMTLTLPDGRTLTAALAHRDMLLMRHTIVDSAISGTRKDFERYSNREIKWVTAVSIGGVQKQLEDPARQIRELNGMIQEVN